MKTKLISSVLAFLFILNMGIFAEYKTTRAASNQDTGLLQDFGLLDVIGKFEEGDTITRSELAVIAVHIYQNDIQLKDLEDGFNDVSKENPYKAYIKMAIETGIMRLTYGKFNPDNTATVGEAVAVLTRLAGYEKLAEVMGGFPDNYMSVARSYGICKTTEKASTQVTLGALNDLFGQFLDANVTNLMLGEYNNIVLEINPEKTALEQYFSAAKIKGIVTGNHKTNLNGTDVAPGNVVKIDGEQYDAGTCGIGDYLGYAVEAYVRMDGEDGTVLSFVPSNKNQTMLIRGEDVVDVDLAGNTLTYYNDKKDKKVKLNPKQDALYNGVYLDPLTKEDLVDIEGSVTLIDNDGDGYYDVISIDSYVVYVVEAASKVTNEIIDKLGKPNLLLDTDNRDIEYKIKSGINEIGIGDLVEWDVLVVRETRNQTGRIFYDIIVSQNSFTGQISGMDDEWITIGEQEYRIGKSLEQAIENQIIAEPSIGKTGTFYVDNLNNIVYCKGDFDGGVDSTEAYGYLLDGTAYTEDFLPEEDSVYFKIFTVRGEVKRLPLARKVKFSNGVDKVTCKDYELIRRPEMEATILGETLKRQLILYKTNTKGEITHVTVAKNTYKNGGGDHKAIEMGYDGKNFSLDLILNDRTKRNEQLVEVNNTRRDFFLLAEESTKVFWIPRPDETGEIDEDYLRIGNYSTLANNEDYIHPSGDTSKNTYTNALVYDFDAVNTPTIIVAYKDSGIDQDASREWSNVTNYFIVTETNHTLDADDNPTIEVTGIWEGRENTKFLPSTDEAREALEEVRPGDILRFVTYDRETFFSVHIVFRAGDRPANEPLLQRYAQTDADGQLREDYSDSGFRLYASDDKAFTYWGDYQWSGGFYSASFNGIGYVEEKIGNRLLFDCNYQFDGYTHALPFDIHGYSSCTLLDLSGAQVKATRIEASDIPKGAQVYINSLVRNIRDIVVIKQ